MSLPLANATSEIILNFDSVYDIIIVFKYNVRRSYKIPEKGNQTPTESLLRSIPQKGAKNNHKNQAADSPVHAMYGTGAGADLGICGRFDSQQ